MSDWFLKNTQIKKDFLVSNEIDTTTESLVGQDTSSRRYFRYSWKDKTILLMETPPDGHKDSLPGHKTKDFVLLADFLRQKGVKTPNIYTADHEKGLILLEDFGEINFKQKSENNQEECYEIATDVLRTIRNNIDISEIDIPDYYQSPVHRGRRRIIDWYFPALHKCQHPEGMVDSYLSVWEQIEKPFQACKIGFCHIDFHFENLMWLDDGKNIEKCGVLDFQGAMKGPLVYDLANLIEDARVIVPDDIQRRMLQKFCESSSKEEKELLEIWYRIIATQFHCRVVGQFIKIAIVFNKPQYLDYIPNVMHYLNKAADHPILQPLYTWFKEHQIAFNPDMKFDLDEIKRNIRDDAF